MNSKSKKFIINNILYIIKQDHTRIIIQIEKNNQIDADSIFSKDILIDISAYFTLFTTIQDLYDDFILNAESNKISIQENNDSYSFILNINIKTINSIKLLIIKKTSNLKSITHQPTSNGLQNRLDELEIHLEKEIWNSTQQINSRLDILEQQMKILIQKVSDNNNLNKHNHNDSYDSQSEQHNIPANSTNNLILGNHLIKDDEMTYKMDRCPINQCVRNKDYCKNNKIATLNSNETMNLRQHQNDINSIDYSINKEITINTSIKLPMNNNCSNNPMIGFLNDQEKDLLFTWLPQSKQTWKMKLVYNPTVGNDTVSQSIRSFYDLSPLLVLIESDTGRKFGGYTSVGWDIKHKSDMKKMDKNAFLFSFDDKSKYPIKKDYYNSAIGCYTDCILVFYLGIYLKNNCLSSKDNEAYLSSYGNGEPQYKLIGGTDRFKVKQLFIYHMTN